MESSLKMVLKLVILLFAIASTLVTMVESNEHDPAGNGYNLHSPCCNKYIGWCCKPPINTNI